MCADVSLFFAAYKYEIHRDAQLDFSGAAQNVEMVCVLNNTSSCTMIRLRHIYNFLLFHGNILQLSKRKVKLRKTSIVEVGELLELCSCSRKLCES